MKKLSLFKSVGQSTTEYAVLLAVVAAALVAMQVYIKRGIQGRIRDLSDQIAPLSSHYESGRSDSNYTTNQSGTTVVQYESGISRVYQDGSDLNEDGIPDSVPETITRSGHEQVSPEEE